ncbi:MAG: ankyrin repeat domain-containing protein [Pyrinomonadaceae bacterium]
MKNRILISVLLASALLFSACGGAEEEKVSPEMSKNMIKLKGYKFDTDGFFQSIQSGDKALVNAFIDAGIDPNGKNKAGATPLIHALKEGDLGVVKAVARKADVNLKDSVGNSPLHLAILLQNKEAVELFLSKNADVNSTGKDGKTNNQSALFAAILASDSELTKKLLEKGADPNIADSDGAFPLAEACVRSQIDMDLVKLLIQKGADVNKAENNGATPLIYAASNQQTSAEARMELIKLLLEKGADKSIKDKSGKTAADWAEKIGTNDAAELLK